MNVGGVDKQSIEEATREAESKPLGFAPGARATYVRDMMKEITAQVAAGKGGDEIKTNKAHAAFAATYPELFKKAVEKQDLSHLEVMLNALDKMESGSLSQHQASILVGQRLVDKFVKPQLNGHGSRK
jgi:hypothetical protein